MQAKQSTPPVLERSPQPPFPSAATIRKAQSRGFAKRSIPDYTEMCMSSSATGKTWVRAWAARDPILWLHHRNIDRLWASWNKVGRSNPTSTTFLNTTFTFADENGQQVVGKVSDVLSILRLGYAYSAYEQVPPCMQSSSTALAE
jgi:tyrosinase